jgi:hypothetical protein
LTKRAFTALTSAIAPEATAVDIAVSEEVCTDMPTLPEVHCPMVKPAVVMVNAEALMTAPEVVMTNDVAVVALQFAKRKGTLLDAAGIVGVTDVAKKLAGYMRVMVPPEGIGVAGVKDSVMVTSDLCAIRSEREMPSATDATEVSAVTIDGKNTKSKNASQPRYKKLLVRFDAQKAFRR